MKATNFHTFSSFTPLALCGPARVEYVGWRGLMGPNKTVGACEWASPSTDRDLGFLSAEHWTITVLTAALRT